MFISAVPSSAWALGLWNSSSVAVSETEVRPGVLRVVREHLGE
jgi:hypothetical protein